LLNGGAGADEFFFTVAGQDTIQGFNAAEDFVFVKGARQLSDLEFVQSDEDVLVRFNDIEIIFNNVTIDEIMSDDIFGF
jgi:hypothetical protein